jgi:hypothetical protein
MRRARGESGFALLLVFAMAASIAILLYTEMPRVVFEAQRVREQTLIDHGEQYSRAIKLFVRKFQRYPQRIEDLESTNNIRFLRRRYKDPMTGKDDWRLIHAGPGGMLTDSKVQKAQSDKNKEKKSENTFVSESLQVGSTSMVLPGQETAPVTPGLAKRASDRAPVSASSMGGGSGTSQTTGTSGTDATGQPVSPDPSQQLAGLLAAGTNPSAQTGTTTQQSLMSGTYPAGAASSQTGGQVPVSVSSMMQQQGAASDPANQNAALALIRNLLTSPRQGGTVGTAATANSQPMAGGIAGVASKLEAEGIKVYNERTAYDEWEFVYDPNKERMVAGMAGTQGKTGSSSSNSGQSSTSSGSSTFSGTGSSRSR